MTTSRPRSPWWSRSRGMSAADHAGWRASLSARPGCPARILAWAQGPDGPVIGSPALLSVARPDGWLQLGWHEIGQGTWNAELGRLSWVLVAKPGNRAGRGSVDLVEPGRLPELFRERIAATIAFERFVPVRGDSGVVVSARRDLRDGGGLTWHSTLTRGLSWSTEGVRAAAEAAIDGLRREYDAS